MAFKIGFMASGGGSNFQAILAHIQDGTLANVSAEFLLTNNSKCGAVAKAQAAGIPVFHVSNVTHPDSEKFTAALLKPIEDYDIDLLVLAGYMKRIPNKLVEKLPLRIINIHPSLLPSFGGAGLWGHHVHEAVVEAGARVSGPTVHFVDGVYDHGRIIAQRAISVTALDTPEIVAEKVLQQEHDIYWRVVKAFAEGLVQVQAGRVICDVQ